MIARIFAITCSLLLTCVACMTQAVDKEALSHLLERAETGHTDGLVLYRGGELIGEWYFGKEPKPVDIKSVTKSMTNLAIGLLHSRDILDIDQEVSDFFPSWKQEKKGEITIRQLLTHTSGLLNSDFALVETAPDVVALALASDLTYPPGTHYDYNNKAVNLLAGIVQKADGRKMDVLLQEELFAPLGITDFHWPRDESGNPYCMAFLQLYPKDLATIGRFVLARGKWEGKQIIEPGWFEMSTAPGTAFLPEYGLLWELIREDLTLVVDDRQIGALQEQLVHPEIIAKSEKIMGRYDGYGAYYRKVREVFGPEWNTVFQKHLAPHGLTLARKEAGTQRGFMGMGYLGQYLVIYPQWDVVAVRLINQYDGYDWDTDEMTEFPELVYDIFDGK
ncbi:MAG: serine hydrolase domain-containing protein [Saprospiraceae bacterium]|nr:serine hydrolase domain-containing protein [Saprospiraceae bacterium]